MDKPLFSIRPMRWEKNIVNNSVQSWWSHTELYCCTVERYFHSERKRWGGWQVNYKIGDHNYIEIAREVVSMLAAKRKAFDYLKERLKPLLRRQNIKVAESDKIEDFFGKCQETSRRHLNRRRSCTTKGG
jgi:hypothetical protein